MSEKDTVRVNITPEVAALAEREAKRGIRWRNGVVAVMGLLGVFGGASFLLDSSAVQESAIGKDLSGPWDELWNVAWLVGGLLVIVGAMWPRPIAELFGWALYVPALVAYTVAVVMYAGLVPAVFLAASVALAGVAKMVYLMAYAPRAVTVKVERRRHRIPDGEEPYRGEERRA